MKNIRQAVAMMPSDCPSAAWLWKQTSQHKQRGRHAADARIEKRLPAYTVHQHQGDHGREHIGNGNQKRGEDGALIELMPASENICGP